MADGRWPMPDGRCPMADARCPMADARWPMADGRWARFPAAGGYFVAMGLLGHFLQSAGSTSCRDLAQFLRNATLFGAAERQNIMGDLKTYRDLDAWQGAMSLSESVYKLTQVFPDTERYGLISQMRRCSVSIPSNIAEGLARGTVLVGLHFLRIAIGSAAELDTQLELAVRLRFVTAEGNRELDRQLERVRQMLYGMRREHQRRLATTGAKAGAVLLVFVAAARMFV